MSSRHVPTKRPQSGVLFSVTSGVLFSAPDETQRVPPDEPSRYPKRLKTNNFQKRIPGVRSRKARNFSYSNTPTLDHPVSLAMFAKYDDHSQYKSSFMAGPSHKEKKATLCLTALNVSSTTIIEGTFSRTTLTQRFHNPSQMTINEARHTFPLYDGAVITDFQCTIGDERRLRGVVRSKEQARQEYKKAVQEKVKAAALLEEHTPEIFETSLGNIPPMKTIEVKIVYIQELEVVMTEGESTEGVAFILPTCVAPHYSRFQPASEITYVGLDIKLLVLNDGKVNFHGCQQESGHSLYYDGLQVIESPQRLDGNREPTPEEFYCWDHHSEQPTLREDFVFIIQMKKGHEIQSRAMLCAPDDTGLAAMMVSIRPCDMFRNAVVPQSFSGKILFLLDQSGSMNYRVGNYHGPRKIDVLREAMLLVISGLPTTCSFNIVSWGSETWRMWEQSREHSPDNVKEAKEYMSRVEANLEGTDLLRAFKSTVLRRRVDTNSTQIIVLTDGELDPHKPMEFNKIRFFALGIGGNVPHSLVESIAELGGGFGDIVDTTQNPRWHSRLNRLFRSSLAPDSWDCDIHISHHFERRSLMDFRLNSNTSYSQRVSYFQVSHTTAALHPFKFTSIFFLMDIKDSGVFPSEITITAVTHGEKNNTYRLPVKQTTGRDGTMHRLAAKATLTDLEDLVKRDDSNSLLIDENAQTIGTKCSITSKWTSFVAVPQDEPATTKEGSMVEHYKAMYEGVDFSELLTMAHPESDDDIEFGYNTDSSLSSSVAPEKRS
ncbi:hypothetical protein ACHAPD_006493 [Fusarium lateritium]